MGLDGRLRSLCGFLAIAHGMADEEKIRMAIAVYAVFRIVPAMLISPDVEAVPLLRLHAKFGRRGSRLP